MTTQTMTYADALAWLYSFSDTERTGVFVHDREFNLERERALLAELGNPQSAYRITHVAGTKGKGSTSAMIAAITSSAGMRTGLYTQPDLHTFRERMRVDGQLISEQDVVRIIPQIRAALARLGDRYGSFITYELATALAFCYFRDAGVDHAVIEVGLGGRLDATNVVEPAVTVITSISYDHMAVLGNTLSLIAREKAGIIKPGVPLVCSAKAAEAVAVITQVAASRHAPLIRVGATGETECQYHYVDAGAAPDRQWFDVRTPQKTYAHLELGLLGVHQQQNATAALAAVECLAQSEPTITEAAIRDGLAHVQWPARLQVVATNPYIVVDGAHNADSLANMFAGLRRHLQFERLWLVFGTMADKDLTGMAKVIGREHSMTVIPTAVQHPRAQSPEVLAVAVRTHAPDALLQVIPSVPQALRTAIDRASAADLICVAGSLYLAGEALRWLSAQAMVIPGAIEIAGVDHPGGQP